jgi:hypothetical protein
LQKQILVMAQANHIKEDRIDHETHSADLYYSEILAAIYGFPFRQAVGNACWQGDRRAEGFRQEVRSTGDWVGSLQPGTGYDFPCDASLELRGLITSACGMYAR